MAAARRRIAVATPAPPPPPQQAPLLAHPSPPIPQDAEEDAELEEDEGIYSASDFESSDNSQVPFVRQRAQRQQRKHVLGCFPASWVIVPRASRFVERWDLVVSVMTMFTAFWTPYQVAFGGEIGSDAENRVWVIEAVLDLTFGFDVIVQFFTAYQPKNGSALWEKDPDKIARHYLRGWFAIDIASVFPVGLIVHCLKTFCWKGRSPDSANWILLFVFLRLLKLLRLLRMARVARVVQRWQYDIGLPYAHLALIRCILMVVLACHWIGCVWGGMGQASRMFKLMGIGDGTTWLTNWVENNELQPLAPYKIYTLCFYFAVVTLTTVGYGDISPQTEIEYTLCTIIIFIGASIWAYVVGGVCAIISKMDPQGTIFQQRMDDLNAVMEMSDTPKAIRQKARDYMHESRLLRQRVSGRAIFGELSDEIRGKLERHHFEEWLKQVWYLADLDPRVVAALAMCTHESLYAPLEAIGEEQERALFYLRRGLVYLYYENQGKGWMVQKGKSWGIDIVVSEEDPYDRCSKKAVTYAEVCSLSKGDFDTVMSNFPAACTQLRKAEVVLLVKRALIRHAKHLKAMIQQGMPARNLAPVNNSVMGGPRPRASLRPPPPPLVHRPPHPLSPQMQGRRSIRPPAASAHVDRDSIDLINDHFAQVVSAIQGVENRLQSTMAKQFANIEDRMTRLESRTMRQF